VLFDFGGTLDADGVPWKERFHRLFAAFGADVAPERFDPIFYAADDALVGAVPPSLAFRDLVETLSRGVAGRLGTVDPAVAARVAEAFLEDSLSVARRNIPILKRLARRYSLGIVSNFYGNLGAVCDDVGVRPFLGVIVDSTWVGCTKPDPLIFRRAIEGLQIAPERATFVGDSLPRDMAGARAVGMPHIWLARAASGTACCPGDRVIHTLNDLEAAL